jgi:hypothetical protein
LNADTLVDSTPYQATPRTAPQGDAPPPTW